jgi:hypothetical protein
MILGEGFIIDHQYFRSPKVNDMSYVVGFDISDRK